MSEQIARQFHDTYERLAPQFGYETRKDTKVFDPQSQNGRLMIAVCAEVIGEIERERDEARINLKHIVCAILKKGGKDVVNITALQRLEELHKAEDHARKLEREREEAREALRDMLSGWKYIRQVHGDLYGVGWDRAQSKAEKALEAAK